ncbi:MAG: hypothetical protein ABW075_07215 [Aeromicrobium sp.]
MRTDHTPISRSAVIATTLLVVVQIARFLHGDHDSYVDALLLTLILAAATASAKMHRDNCVESRAASGLVALLSAGGVALGATAGLPGQQLHPFGLYGVLTLTLSLAVLGLLAADQPRRASDRRVRSPYAL